MPILQITVVSQDDEPGTRVSVASIADAAGRIFESAPGGTWVSIEQRPRSQYAENGGGPPDAVRPVFVRVLLADWGSEAARATWARALAQAIGPILMRPVGNVHIIFEPPARGRVAFGGALRTS